MRAAASPSRTTARPGGTSSRSICFAISPSFSPGRPASSSTRWSSAIVAGTNLGVAAVLDLLRVLVPLAAHRVLLGHALGRLLLLLFGRLRVVVHGAPLGRGSYCCGRGRAGGVEVLSALPHGAAR